MEMLYGLSSIMLAAAVFFAYRLIKQYLDGLKKAGDVLLSLPRKRYNADIIGAGFFGLLGLNDIFNGDYMVGFIIMVVAGLLYKRGMLPYQFHENGIVLEMEYFPWGDIKAWAWDENGKPEVVLKFEGKPGRSIRSTTGKEEMERFFTTYTGKAPKLNE